jgi:hypothetical protein
MNIPREVTDLGELATTEAEYMQAVRQHLSSLTPWCARVRVADRGPADDGVLEVGAGEHRALEVGRLPCSCGIRVSPGPSNQFRDVPLARKGNETTPISGRCLTVPNPADRMQVRVQYHLLVERLGIPPAGPGAWTRPAARRTQVALRRRPAHWPQPAVGEG